jgi:hypothetical protein
MTNTAAKSAGLPVGSNMSVLMAMAKAALAEKSGTDAIQNAPDPLGAFLSGLAGVGTDVGDLSAVGSANLAAGANAVSSVTGIDPLDAMMGATGAFGTAGGGGGGGDSGLSGGDFGDTGGASLGGGLGGGGFDPSGSAGFGLADGGIIQGPGTGTSDSIQAKNKTAGGSNVLVSAGERIIPADVANQYKDLFDSLIAAHHRPVRR